MRGWLVLSILLLSACGAHNISTLKDKYVDPLSDVNARLAFACTYEKNSASPSDADILFQYARWLQKNNQLKRDLGVTAQIERLYRIAAEQSHYKANINLQNGALRGHFKLRGKEHLRLSEELIGADIATGYLFVAYFLRRGSAGLREDQEMALRYFRRAADAGNAQAQYYVADKLAPIDIAPEIARQMRRCAAEQGHGKAAVALSINLKNKGEFREALELLQMGTAAGYESAPGRLEKAFRVSAMDEMYYLDQKEDLERARRYETIWRILARYSYANPKVPEINEIVPLPPAKLPPWDGKLQWLEARRANIPPEKPSEALIQRLAEDKQLDPATGRPLPASPHFIKASLSPPLMCNSGTACPQSGYWELIGLEGSVWNFSADREICLFEQGQPMPTRLIPLRYSRIWPLPDLVTHNEEQVRWQFYGEV
ncbi:SEL1-like repeat protein [Pseudomonas putida]